MMLFTLGLGAWLIGMGLNASPYSARGFGWVWMIVGGVCVLLSPFVFVGTN